MAKHGESKHYKRSVISSSLVIPRKKYKYFIRQMPGKHEAKWSVALLGFLRDVLKISSNGKETRYLIKSGYVSVDGRVVKDEKFSVGFGDIVNIKTVSFRSSIDKNGKIVGVENQNGNVKTLKLISKSKAKGNRIVLRFNDGRNLIDEGKHNLQAGDSVVLDLTTNKIIKTMSFEQGSKVLIYKGKNAGIDGKIVSIDEDTVKIDANDRELTVSKGACFVQ